MKIRIAEVSYEGRIEEYDVVADDNIHARDLVVKYLEGKQPTWTSIRVRDTLETIAGPPRVIGKKNG
jgi:hypothetical protein